MNWSAPAKEDPTEVPRNPIAVTIFEDVTTYVCKLTGVKFTGTIIAKSFELI